MTLARITTPHTLLRAFLSGRNPNTLRAYSRDLADFQRYIKAENPAAAVAQLLGHGAAHANLLVLEYRTHLREERGLSAATANRRLTALKSLTKLARILGLVNFRLELEALPVQEYRDTRGPGADGVQKLLRLLAGKKDAKSLRDRAMVRLLFDLALRRIEVIRLQLADVDVKRGEIWILGKGQTEKIRLTLPPETLGALTEWIRVRGEQPGALFLCLQKAHYGQPLTVNGLYFLICDLGKRAGIRTRPHGLRHAAISAALDATNGNVRAVQKFSRHKKVDTVIIYDDSRKDLAGDVSKLIAKKT